MFWVSIYCLGIVLGVFVYVLSYSILNIAPIRPIKQMRKLR